MISVAAHLTPDSRAVIAGYRHRYRSPPLIYVVFNCRILPRLCLDIVCKIYYANSGLDRGDTGSVVLLGRFRRCVIMVDSNRGCAAAAHLKTQFYFYYAASMSRCWSETESGMFQMKRSRSSKLSRMLILDLTLNVDPKVKQCSREK